MPLTARRISLNRIGPSDNKPTTACLLPDPQHPYRCSETFGPLRSVPVVRSYEGRRSHGIHFSHWRTFRCELRTANTREFHLVGYTGGGRVSKPSFPYDASANPRRGEGSAKAKRHHEEKVVSAMISASLRMRSNLWVSSAVDVRSALEPKWVRARGLLDALLFSTRCLFRCAGFAARFEITN